MPIKKISQIVRLFSDEKYRFSVLGQRGLYRWMSDEKYIKRYYKYRTGKELNLMNPSSFNEKMQWLKLHWRDKSFINMVDKYEAKRWAASIIGVDHIISTLGVWEHFSEIDFSKLPDQFVLKCTHDSGGLIICRDKNCFDLKSAKRKINFCLSKNFYDLSREWAYKYVKPRIIAEEYITDEYEQKAGMPVGLMDYKFFCFHSIPRLLYVSKGLENHSTARISFVDMNGKEMPFHRRDYQPFGQDIALPQNFEEMRTIAECLAKAIECPFVRVDLYSVRGKVFFSEVTFTPCGGTIPFEPDEWDYRIGEWLQLPSKTNYEKVKDNVCVY